MKVPSIALAILILGCSGASRPSPTAPARQPEITDRDGDGLTDAADLCPCDAEDVDAFTDEDGCPDLDDDADGLADVCDRCPHDPETLDGEHDEDGCPDAAGAPMAVPLTPVVPFEVGSADPSPRRDAAIEALVRAIDGDAGTTVIRIYGSAGPRETDAPSLAMARAISVRDALVARGIDPEHLELNVQIGGERAGVHAWLEAVPLARLEAPLLCPGGGGPRLPFAARC